MHSFSYPATFRLDSRGRVLVGFPDLPEAHTDGRAMQEAVEEAIDCLASAIAFPKGLKSRRRLRGPKRACARHSVFFRALANPPDFAAVEMPRLRAEAETSTY